MDEDGWEMRQELEGRYPIADQVFSSPDIFFPVTGMRTRPELMYRLSR